MARGPSGRIVAEIEPERKRELYAALAADGLTFKDWLMATSAKYIEQRRQPELPGMPGEESHLSLLAEEAAAYGKRKERSDR